MVIDVKLTVGGTVYSDFLQMDLNKNIGDFNATSHFTIEFNNRAGIHKDSFSLNEEVVIYTDIDTDPATTKIFTGIIEDISPMGEGEYETITIIGRDYGAVLQDMTVQPIIFKNQDAGEIAKVIVESNALGVVSTNNIDTSTGTIVEKIAFNHKNIFDSLQELAELSEFSFYVDVDKDVHFKARAGTSSGLTFDNTNVVRGTFLTSDKEIFNKIWVYGDRMLTGHSQHMKSDGSGSVFILDNKPHNTRVYISGTIPAIVQPGGIFEMDNPATKDVKWLLNFSEKKVIFASGTTAGDNIPAAGSVYFEYARSTPILKFKHDTTSISSYGPKTKIISDENIKDFAHADAIATAFLADNKDPKIEGDLNIKGVIDITPGETAVVDLPWHNIDSQTYTMIHANYSFNKTNCLSEHVLSITVNKKVADFVDTMKDQMVRLKKVETGPLEGNITRLETFAGNINVGRHYEVYTKDIGQNFILHSGKHGLVQDLNSRIGVGVLGSTLATSGGDF